MLCITNPGIVMPLLKMAFPLSRGAASKDAATCAEAAGSEQTQACFTEESIGVYAHTNHDS